MKFLVDTQLVLWAASSPRKISKKARALLKHPDNALFFSAASLWEIAIKNSLGREDFKANPGLLRRGLLDNGWQELPITGRHAIAVEHLPAIHKDPFDRILLAQAKVEGFVLLTTDSTVSQYPDSALLV